MSDTPWVDERVGEFGRGGKWLYKSACRTVHVDDARQLERELAAANGIIFRYKCGDLRHQIVAEAEAERDKLETESDLWRERCYAAKAERDAAMKDAELCRWMRANDHRRSMLTARQGADRLKVSLSTGENMDTAVQGGIVSEILLLIDGVREMDLAERIDAINTIREALHNISPFKNEPVDFVRWVPSESVSANDYNPNSVAPPEMELLRLSIMADGYTQPVVANREESGYVVIDGFHRNRVGKECRDVMERVLGYLPVVQIKQSQTDRGDRIASTIRHNRARGKHKVEAMADIVIELKRRNWSDEKIGKNLGMDPDEVLRLSQITGLAEMFANQEFSKAWDIGEDEDQELLGDVPAEQPKNGRVFHTWEKWECYRAGFYEDSPPNGMKQEEGEEKYREFLSDLPRFEAALAAIISEWKFSCEHYLTNDRMNRIAWLGQAAVAYALGIPSCCRGGYNLLTDEQKRNADLLALQYLNKWLAENGRDLVTEEQALSRTMAELY